MSYIQIPIPDVSKPWGGPCTARSGTCTGHFLSPEDHLDRNFMKIPPKDNLDEAFKGGNYDVEELAKSCLLTMDEVEWWREHLQSIANRRKAGAKKAAEKRKRAKQAQGT